MLIVHHTDAERKWPYDRNSSIGKLDEDLDVAKAEGWTAVDMKNDWNKIFPLEADEHRMDMRFHDARCEWLTMVLRL